MTESMKRAIDETDRRRQIQVEYNEAHGITPESIIKPLDVTMVAVAEADYVVLPDESGDEDIGDDAAALDRRVEELESEMREAARRFEFERAADLRDRARALRTRRLELA
jgi:excinuclease ABC subunit B